MQKKWKIGLAVSGGADSTALALLMAALRREYDFEAVVLHVDHSLRKESAGDAAFVRKLAKSLQLPFHGVRVKIVRKRGESLEMAARRERLDFFAKMTNRLNLDAVATGHHLDDVVETLVMRLARGSGPEGLAGIKRISHVNGITFIRPLLDVRDAELKAFLTRHGITWREDATNADTSILRNRVRHVILPFLRENLDRHISEHIAKTAAILRGELTLQSSAKPSTPAPDFSVPETYQLTITPACGYVPTRGIIGELPSSAYLSRKRLLKHRHLELRTRRDGDRIAPTGMNGKSRKLKDVFVTAKVPQIVRQSLPVLADADTSEILWIPGYRVAECVAVESPSAESWLFTLSPQDQAGKTAKARN